jgi:hypothetical protein
MLSLALSDALGSDIVAHAQDWRPPRRVMGVRCENMNAALVEHPLGPVAGPATKPTGERSGGDLHPNAGLPQALDHRVLCFDP